VQPVQVPRDLGGGRGKHIADLHRAPSAAWMYLASRSTSRQETRAVVMTEPYAESLDTHRKYDILPAR
jgi:hypothetical protein